VCLRLAIHGDTLISDRGVLVIEFLGPYKIVVNDLKKTVELLFQTCIMRSSSGH